MKKRLKERLLTKKIALEAIRAAEINQRMILASSLTEKEVLLELGTTNKGLCSSLIGKSREEYGDNIVRHGKKESLLKRICNAFVNPFTAILFALAVVSTFTDIIFATPEDKSYITVIIITTMVMISGLLRFVQETRSGNAAAKLSQMIHTTTCVERLEAGKQEISLNDVVVGDIVHLSAGDMVPADVRILFAKDLFISQSALTGESEPVEKQAKCQLVTEAITEITNLAFMGSNVISGSATAVVVAVEIGRAHV